MKESFESHLEFRSPDLDSINNDQLEKLHETWRLNHNYLTNRLINGKLKYFGLHGTTTENFGEIIKNEEGEIRLEIATFYEKSKDEDFLYKLYQMASYVSAYANRVDKNKSKAGKIIILDLEDSGKNITRPWEHLKMGSGMESTLKFDSKKERRLFEFISHDENLLWRSDIIIEDKEFKKIFASIFDFSGKDQYLSPIIDRDLGKEIIKYRFLAQEIIKKSFDLMLS